MIPQALCVHVISALFWFAINQFIYQFQHQMDIGDNKTIVVVPFHVWPEKPTDFFYVYDLLKAILMGGSLSLLN